MPRRDFLREAHFFIVDRKRHTLYNKYEHMF
jgi:hypothetical protein